MSTRPTVPSSDVVVVGAGLAGHDGRDRPGRRGRARRRRRPRPRGDPLDVGRPRRRRARRAAPRPPRASPSLRRCRDTRTRSLDVTLAPAIDWLRGILAAEGLTYLGDLDEPLRPVPTAIGATRRAGTLPTAQAAALRPWRPDERLVICGPAGFKDFWPGAIAASLERPSVWGRSPRARDRPASVEALVVELPDIAGRRNLTALHLARLFDDPSWRADAFAAIAAALRGRGGAPGRIAPPCRPRAGRPRRRVRRRVAVAAAHPVRGAADPAERARPAPVRGAPRGASPARRQDLGGGGGGPDRDCGPTGHRRSRSPPRRAIACSGLAASSWRRAGLPAAGSSAGPTERSWSRSSACPSRPRRSGSGWRTIRSIRPAIRSRPPGIRTDAELHPVDGRGRVAFDNVAIVGSLLAGQHYLSERCGDGVAVASGRRAAAMFAAKPATKPRAERQKAGAAR